MEEKNILEQKQQYLREEILEKSYDIDEFTDFMSNYKENGTDIQNWEFIELKKAVKSFKNQVNENKIEKGLEKISSGPVKGIYTTKENKAYYDDLLALLQNISNDEPQSEKSVFIAGAATWAYTAFQNLRCSAPTTWRTFFDDIRLQTYYDEFPKNPFPDYVILLDSKNPDNGGRYQGKNDEENIKDTWMYKKITAIGYENQIFPCGIVYSLKTIRK